MGAAAAARSTRPCALEQFRRRSTASTRRDPSTTTRSSSLLPPLLLPHFYSSSSLQMPRVGGACFSEHHPPSFQTVCCPSHSHSISSLPLPTCSDDGFEVFKTIITLS